MEDFLCTWAGRFDCFKYEKKASYMNYETLASKKFFFAFSIVIIY